MRQPGFSIMILFLLTNAAEAQTTISVPYTTPNRGGTTIQTLGGTGGLIVGYGRAQPVVTTIPTGVAILGFRPNGVLVSEAGVPGVTTMVSGRTYVEINGLVNTGVAFVNPNTAPVVITYNFTDQGGNEFAPNSFILGPNAQIARFLNQSPFNASSQFAGAFTFTASAPVAVIALRGVTNQRGDFLISTQVVTSLPASFSSGPLVIGHFADGGGWRTQVVLVNPTDATLTGVVQFFSQGSVALPGVPLTLNVNGQVSSSFAYTIRARSSVRFLTAGLDGVQTQAGSIRVTPTQGSLVPAGFALFSFTIGGVLQTETAVAAQPAAITFRTYVEIRADDPNTVVEEPVIQSAIAVSNTSSTAATVNFELFDLSGISVGFGTAVNALIPPNGQISRFVLQLFPGLPLPFRGLLRVTSGTTPVVLVSLRARINERSDFLITTIPTSNEALPATTLELFFPHIVDGGGYNTQFILFSGITGQNTTGILRFFSQSGLPLIVNLN